MAPSRLPVRVEVKGRSRFAQLQAWLAGADMLVLIPDRAPEIYVLTRETLERIKQRC